MREVVHLRQWLGTPELPGDPKNCYNLLKRMTGNDKTTKLTPAGEHREARTQMQLC